MTIAQLLPYGAAAAAVAVGITAIVRRRHLMADWVIAAGMFALGAEAVLSGLSAGRAGLADIENVQHWRLYAGSLIPGLWLVFSLGYARGNYRESLSQWRAAIAAAFALPVGLSVVFRDSLVVSLTSTPGGPPWDLRLGLPGIGLCFCQLMGAVMVLMNLERTFRAAVGAMRWRIKFALLGVGALFVVRLYTSSQALLFRSTDPTLQALEAGALLVSAGLILWSFFRTAHGRFDFDVYPSRTVLQGSLTVLLAGIYLVAVGTFAKVVTYIGGAEAFAVKTFAVLVALVVLAILLQSDRVRLGIGRFVSRHFQRPIHDYRRMWKRFTEGTATCVEQGDLCRALVRIIADMFQALSVSIWLLDDKKELLVLAASTSIPAGDGPDAETRKADAAEVVRYFQGHGEPADFETVSAAWAEVLRKAHPSVFPHGGNRIGVPLISRGEVLGIITVGDRVAGTPYTLQDFDMLKCVGDDAAGSVLNVQLSQRLLQSKELEAFQTMAAFFVHDLKNAASTLNLMLKNLPVHFDDPAFRADALRGMEKTVTHINGLISRLGLLRHELKMRVVDSDLGEVVNQALAGLEMGPSLEVTKELSPVPKAVVDREQIAKVVINLVLNARESVPAQQVGRIHIATAQNNGWAVITVRDNGCGMSPEFLSRSLFRPFQTTKKSGLGIGMFQSKLIVEAHGGRIKVDSEAGKGTTFQVFLPLARNPG